MLNAENSERRSSLKQTREKQLNDRENGKFGFSELSPAVICTAAAIGSTQTVGAGVVEAASKIGNQSLLAMLEYGAEEARRIDSIAAIMHDSELSLDFGGCPETEYTPREGLAAAEQASFAGVGPLVDFSAVEALAQPYMS